MMPPWVEQRVLSLLMLEPQRTAETQLLPEDFQYPPHRRIFSAIVENGTADLLVLGLPEDVSIYALELDEAWAPGNLGALCRMLRAAREQRRFAQSVEKLRGIPKGARA